MNHGLRQLRTLVYAPERMAFSEQDAERLGEQVVLYEQSTGWRRGIQGFTLAMALLRRAPELLHMALDTFDMRWRCQTCEPMRSGIYVLAHKMGQGFVYSADPANVIEWRHVDGCGAKPWHERHDHRVGGLAGKLTETTAAVAGGAS